MIGLMFRRYAWPHLLPSTARAATTTSEQSPPKEEKEGRRPLPVKKVSILVNLFCN
jgi:hypothetical protein